MNLMDNNFVLDRNGEKLDCLDICVNWIRFLKEGKYFNSILRYNLNDSNTFLIYQKTKKKYKYIKIIKYNLENKTIKRKKKSCNFINIYL